MKQYSVWVGGGEVNDHHLPLDKALYLSSQWIQDGYEDVLVAEVTEWNAIHLTTQLSGTN